jgi:hypothetical protein
MRIYWLNGSLTIQPEDEKETALMHEIISAMKYEPIELETIGSGQTESGSQLTFEALIPRDELGPSSFPRQQSH